MEYLFRSKDGYQFVKEKKEVPFLFPVRNKSRREEAVLSAMIILAMQFILTLPL
jgi:hypothetical protein